MYLERGLRAVSPTLALAVFGGAAPANLGIALDVRGPILSTANSCASGAVAIGEAMGAIRAGEIDAAIAGGVECPLSPLAFGAFDLIRALAATAQRRPGARVAADGRRAATGSSWARARGCSCSRPRTSRRRRGARPYAGVHGLRRDLGRATTWSSRAPTAGRRRARSRIALADAGVDADEIDWVSAHASSTPIGDIAEARALAAALGDRPPRRSR